MAAPIDPRLLRRSAATRGYLIATVAVGLAQTAALVAQAWLVATSVVGIVDGGGFSSDLARRLGLLAGVVAVRSGLAWAQQWLGHRASAAVKSQLRTEVMAARLRRPQQAGVSQGRLATLVGPGLDALDGWYAKFLPQLVLGVLAPVVVIVMVGRVDLLSAVIIAATLPLIPLFMVLVGLATQHQLDRRWRANAVLGHHFADLLAGLTTLQLFGRARSQAVGLERTERRHRSETMRTLRVAFLSSLVLELLATLSVALVAVTVGLRVVDAQLALLPALFVLVLAPEAFLPLRQVGAHYHDAADGTAAASEALGLIESADPDQPDDAQIPTVTRIQMSGVGTDRTAELSAELRRGELTVVTGPSGSGKTTALHLLMGWLQPTSGRITLHGDDDIVLDPSTAAAWRRQVAWVSQDPALAPGTVEDNIRFGTLATRQQAREALDRCGGATIDLDLLVGDDDQGLSVGERRRVALARALLRVELAGAGWLLLDEPTAGLDADTEAEVIAQLPAELGVVLVSHRPAVIAAATHTIPIPLPPRAPLPPRIHAPSTDPRPPQRASISEEGVDPTGVGVSANVSANASPRRGAVVLAVVLGVLAAGCGVALIGTAAWLLSRASEHPPVLHLMVAVTLVRFFGIGKGVFRYAERLVGHDVALREQSGLRISTYRRLMDRVMAGDLTSRRQDLVSRLTQDVATTLDLTVRVMMPRIVAVVVGIAAVVTCWWISPAAGVVLAAGLLAAVLLAPWLGDLLARRGQRDLAAARAALAEATGRAHRLAPEINAHDRIDDQLGELAGHDRGLRRIEQRAASATGVAAAIQVAALGLVTLLALVVSAPAVVDHRIAPTLVAVLALVPMALMDVVQPLPGAALARRAAGTALGRVSRIGREAPPIADPERVSDTTARTQARIVLDRVSVGWNAEEPVLAGISRTITAGERIAVTGRSGLGKTSLALTVAGLLPTAAGRLEVHGRVGMLGQDAHLFDTTVRENLRLAAPHADDATLAEALERAGVDLDLDRRVGEHGGTISGGEARRLAMARLLLREVDVVVLDEPTEHLDADTADALLDDIERLWPDALVLAITHDPDSAIEHLGATVWDLTEHATDPGPGRTSSGRTGQGAPPSSDDAPARIHNGPGTASVMALSLR